MTPFSPLHLFLLSLSSTADALSPSQIKAPPRCPGFPNCGCDGSGRIAGGLGPMLGVDWLPKAYRACPAFEKSGGVYTPAFVKSSEVGFDSMQVKRPFAFDNPAVGTLQITQDPKNYVAVGDGTGMVTWGSAFCLSDLLQRGESAAAAIPGFPESLAGARVVELGAGLGLLSLVATKLGASRVVATDGSTNVLDLLRNNAKSNLTPEELGRLEVRQLRWVAEDETDDLPRDLLAGGGGGGEEEEVVVLMADVCYQRNAVAWPALVNTVGALTEEVPGDESQGAKPVVLWAHAARDDESRLESERFERDLLEPLRRKFTVRLVDSALLHPAYQKSNVRVFVLTRR